MKKDVRISIYVTKQFESDLKKISAINPSLSQSEIIIFMANAYMEYVLSDGILNEISSTRQKLNDLLKMKY